MFHQADNIPTVFLHGLDVTFAADWSLQKKNETQKPILTAPPGGSKIPGGVFVATRRQVWV